MKKLLGTAIAAILMFPVSSSAELLKNLKVSGNLDMQMNSAQNVTDASHTTQDRVSNVITRTMLHGDWDMLDDVHGNITLRKNDKAWGDTGGIGQGATGNSQQVSGAAGTGVLGNIFMDRANVSIDKVFGWADVKVGRQFYGEKGDLIWYAGPRDTASQDVMSVDAFRIQGENDWVKFDGLAGQLTNALGAAFGAGAAANVNVKGVNLWWKGLPMKVNTYLWNQTTKATGPNSNATTGRNDNLYVYGVKLRGEAAGGWINLDLAKNAGECRGNAATRCGLAAGDSSNYTGHAALLDLGWNADLANVGGITPWASFGIGTGRSDSETGTNDQFQMISSDWRPGVINRRFSVAGTGAGGAAVVGSGLGALPNGGTDNVTTTGLGNRVVFGFGTNFTPAAMDQLTVGVQVWDYRLQRNDASNWNTPAANAHKGNKHLGTEGALTFGWNHSENVMLSAGAARFWTGGYIKEQQAAATGDNPVTAFYSDISIRF